MEAPPLRFDSVRDSSLADPLPPDPMPLLRAWLEDAVARPVRTNPLAMALATVDAHGLPQVRMVLCRGYDLERGWFVFYTDRRSPKARSLESRGRAALLFHWDAHERQVRIEGPIVRAPDADSDRYFAGRPLDAQLAAATSQQSAPIASRHELVERMQRAAERHGVRGAADDPRALPRPGYWGGYRVFAERIELWLGQPGRVHDRGLWTRALSARDDGFAGGPWSLERLQP
jgi:pyridoxamine 5'-phosphate oxidase